ncbi:unnamed protein product [Closterium sp. NIES-65]|nr:unnamed protein product [Closterium sp. NIES-65]
MHSASPQHMQQQRGLKHSTSRTSLDSADDDRPPGANGVGGAEMVTVKLAKSDWLEIVNALESASSRCENCGETSPSAPSAVSLPATQRLFAQLKARSNGPPGGGANEDILNRKLLTIITKAHDLFSKDQQGGDYLLAQLLDLTKSKFGFVASALKKPEGTYYLKTHSITNFAVDEGAAAVVRGECPTHGITNFAWTRELRLWYAENAPSGLVFSNMDTLFGRVVTTADVVISNDVPNDPRACGRAARPPACVHLSGGASLRGSSVRCRRDGAEREEQERLRAMLKGTGDAILGVDDMGGISALNRAARLLFGFTDTEGLGDSSGRAFGQAEVLPENLHVADLFISVDGRDDFADQGLEVFVCDGLRMPAIGRRILGGTLLLEMMLSRGSNPDVAYVITARELKNSGLGGTPTIGSGSNSLARTGSKGGPTFFEPANMPGGDE